MEKTAQCARCHASYSYTTTRGTEPKYCSPECKLLAGSERQSARSAADAARRAAIRALMRCVVCDAPMPGKKMASAKFCSKRCSSAYGRARESGQCAECARPIRAKGLCGTHYNRTYHPGSQRLWPGDPEARRAALRRKTQKRRAVVKGVEAETVDRDKVGDRDGWRCFCGKKINHRLPWPHPRSASLDHIVPISEGGPHTYANCRIAHLACNTQRSNRGGGEQLALLGGVA